MKPGANLRFTLLGDGSSDRVLLPILSWLIRDIIGQIPLEAQWADLGQLSPAERPLPQRVRKALNYYPCQILFVHRDAVEARVGEIQQACAGLEDQAPGVMAVCVIPVRMTEAWLLFDASAIRRAAGNPQGRKALNLPSLQQMERVHAKEVLHQALRDASELTGRKAKKLEVSRAIHVIADFIGDYRQLDHLPSFARLRCDLANALRSPGFGRPA